MSDNTENDAVPQPRLRSALNQVRPSMEKLGREELLQVNVDPFVAIATARGALPQIMKYRDKIVVLPDFDRANLDELETYARAAQFTQNMLLAASAPPEHFAALVAECSTLRDTLLNDATALARRGLIPEAPLQTLKGTTGHKNVASDLMTLCLILQAAWPKLVGKTCVTEAELERAEILSDQLVNDVGAREQGPATIAQVALERQQAFTIFMNAYDELRRAMGYIRWSEGDADEIAPSLYSGRGTSRKKTQSDLEKPPQTVVSPTVPAATSATTPATPNASAPQAPSIGLPGADPFVH